MCVPDCGGSSNMNNEGPRPELGCCVTPSTSPGNVSSTEMAPSLSENRDIDCPNCLLVGPRAKQER